MSIFLQRLYPVQGPFVFVLIPRSAATHRSLYVLVWGSLAEGSHQPDSRKHTDHRYRLLNGHEKDASKRRVTFSAIWP